MEAVYSSLHSTTRQEAQKIGASRKVWKIYHVWSLLTRIVIITVMYSNRDNLHTKSTPKPE